MTDFYVVIELQINDGVAVAAPAVIKNQINDALGEMYVKLGYAYQFPRDYTEVFIVDRYGSIVAAKVFDNRTDTNEDIYTCVEIQINDGTLAIAPITCAKGATSQSTVMQAYHNSLSYAWNIGRDYTCEVVVDKNGYQFAYETIKNIA